MARGPTWEERLQALNALEPTTSRTHQNDAVSAALADPHYRVVARAAALAAERSLHERIADLLAAYPRFLHDGVKRDPHCVSKAAITAALLALECDRVQFWREGIHCRQLEPAWGGATDTAVDVRCNCALGLVNTGHSRAIVDLAGLLHDPEHRVRAGAARAISCGDPVAAEALLRFKVMAGDREAEVLGECFTALLAVAPDESLPLVAAHLKDKDEAVRDFAALALGESRHPQALEHLVTAWNDAYLAPGLRSVLARAAALLRSEAAFDWLVGIIAKGRAVDAQIAADALSVYDRNLKLMQRVREAQAGRKDTPPPTG